MLFKRATTTATADRRQEIRIEPPGVILVAFDRPQRSLPDAVVVNISRSGAALRSPRWIDVGQRLSFCTGDGRPPVLAEVLACEATGDGDGSHFVRCRCILGGFDMP